MSDRANRNQAKEEAKVPSDRKGRNDALNEQMDEVVNALKHTFTGPGTTQGKTGR
jgi:hypothetical protein